MRYTHAAGRSHGEWVKQMFVRTSVHCYSMTFLGLRLVLKSVQEEYICTSDSAGFVLSLQNQSEDPFPETKGFYASPGVVTTFVFTRVSDGKI